MNLRIRKAAIKDLSDLVDLLGDCVRGMQAHNIDQWDPVYPTEVIVNNDISDGGLFVLERENQIVGCVALNSKQEPEYAAVSWNFSFEPVAVVHRLMVHPNVQGKGFARMLMGYIEHKARKLGYRTIRLDAFSENPAAVRLYDRMGYRKAGTVHFRKGVFHCFEKIV
ncbi:MAG: GNAT family N-acetyltransferase [Deltaproteobacteria bacterium]|nr:GNAT family N-acetyltransferase [Deltaproteobacteria bacterium]